MESIKLAIALQQTRIYSNLDGLFVDCTECGEQIYTTYSAIKLEELVEIHMTHQGTCR